MACDHVMKRLLRQRLITAVYYMTHPVTRPLPCLWTTTFGVGIEILFSFSCSVFSTISTRSPCEWRDSMGNCGTHQPHHPHYAQISTSHILSHKVHWCFCYQVLVACLCMYWDELQSITWEDVISSVYLVHCHGVLLHAERISQSSLWYGNSLLSANGTMASRWRVGS